MGHKKAKFWEKTAQVPRLLARRGCFRVWEWRPGILQVWRQAQSGRDLFRKMELEDAKKKLTRRTVHSGHGQSKAERGT